MKARAWLRISIRTMPVTLKVDERLSHKECVKHITLPLCGVPNGAESMSVAGNQLRAFLGPVGREGSDAWRSCPVLPEAALDEASLHEVINNRGKRLLIECNVFIHSGTRKKPNQKGR